MSAETDQGLLHSLYRNRVGQPTTHDEVRGYWVFLTGLVFGTLGLVLFLLSETARSSFTLRELSIVLAAVGLAMLMAGPVIRLPLQSWANYAAYAGQAIAFLAAVWFMLVFPGDWSVASGNQPAIVLYASGLATIGVGGIVAPLLSSTTREDLAASESRGDELETEVAALQEERDQLQSEATAATAASGAAREELAGLRESKARFELYEDRGGEWRWRLRHRNGNTIATSGQGYTRRHNAQKGLESVRTNALGATVLLIETEDELPEEEAFEPVREANSSATFEVYEDAAGEHRWRLRHDNGNILADSSEGYSSESGLREALDHVKDYAGPGEYLRVDPTAFQVYRDAAGEWRWRLVHRNGNVLADGGGSYTRRRDARRAVDSIREGVEDMSFEVYEDAAGEHRWRLTSNGTIVGDSGEGYASKSGAEDAVERVRGYAPEGDALDIGWAAFEIYEDEGGKWRWRLRHRNGNVMADGGEGYATRPAAREAVDRFKREAPNGPVGEQS